MSQQVPLGAEDGPKCFFLRRNSLSASGQQGAVLGLRWWGEPLSEDKPGSYRGLKLFRFVVTCGRVKLFEPNHVRELP